MKRASLSRLLKFVLYPLPNKNVKILGKGYRTNFKRRVSEALFIKELKPDLNKQKDAFKLKLYN